MKQGPPRLQHYIPQLLLKRFAAGDGKLWAYDAEQRKMFRSAPKGLAAEGYFYGPTTAHATDQSTAIEKWFSNEVEAPGAEAMATVLEKRMMTGAQAHAFFRFVAAQMQRTPASLRRTGDHFSPIFQEMAERMAKYDPEFRKNVIANVKEKGTTDEDLVEFVKILDEGKFTVTPTREFAIASALHVLERVAQELAKMRWTFLDVYPTDGDLIIGDHPVTLADVSPAEISSAPLGIMNPHIEIAMPLSPRMVAIAHWDGPISFGELCQGMSDILLERAVSLRGTGPQTHIRRVQFGEKLIISTELW
jgi:hypothetical protein